MKKLLASAICILVLIGCRKEYHTPSTENQTTQENHQAPPKCGIDLDAELTAKMIAARRPRDDQEKVSRRKPKDVTDPIESPTIIFLDTDGHTVQNTAWNWSGTFDCSNPGLTADQMTAIIKSVSEDFSAFQISVTADVSLYNNTPKEKRIHVVVTNYRGLEHIFPRFGGIAFRGSLWWQDDTPCFVFADAAFGFPPYIAEIVSHEVGHTIGLNHQSEFNADGSLKYEYHSGFYLPWNITWRAIMGSGYNGDVSGWMFGRTLQGTQNDTELLSAVRVNADAVPDMLTSAKQLKLNGREKQIKVNELINKQADADYYVIHSREIKFSGIGYGNCDLKISAYNNDRKLIAEFNDQQSISISEKTIKSKGNKIYLKVEANDLLPDQIQSAGQYTLLVKKM